MNVNGLLLSQKKELVDRLKASVTEQRIARMLAVMNKRTRHLTVVMEDIYQSQNASAVLRSCDCTGIQDVHIIENRNTYEINPDVALGASKWLTLYRYDEATMNTASCMNHLKDQGYRIVATSPHSDEHILEDLPVTDKTALVFGNELNGLTDVAMNMADAFVRIPMVGFTESFNISVSAAICLYNLAPRIRSSVPDWELSEEEQTDLLLEWLLRSIANGEALLAHHLKTLI